jgi:hypothetical protein
VSGSYPTSKSAEVAAVQERLRQALAGLPADAVAGNPLLARIVGYLRKGEQVFFC